MSEDFDFDVIVLGGGSAGSSAAAAAAAEGANVAMVNDGELGGLCILRGCMPTKAMLQTTHLLHEIAHAGALGVKVENVSHDFGFIMERKSKIVARFKRAKLESIENSTYEVIDGRGSFLDEDRIQVGNRTLRARAYVIATGSRPPVPDIPGIENIDYMTSDDVMELKSSPRSLLVQGAGAIGMELAQFFARLGVKVFHINRSAACSKIDSDIAAEMEKVMSDEPNLDFLSPATITKVSRSKNGIVFDIDGPSGHMQHEAASFLVATGRNPAVDNLGLDKAGILRDAGRLRHDKHLRTTNQRVFVAGDATGTYQILHLANQEGRIAGANAAGVNPAMAMDYRLKMSVVFTDPPFAQVGETEREAIAAGKSIFTGIKRFPSQGRAITMETRHGLLKVVADRSSGEIMGAQILGPRADDLIHIIASIMHFRGGVADLNQLPWYHPTLSESLIEIGRNLAGQMNGISLPPAPPA